MLLLTYNSSLHTTIIPMSSIFKQLRISIRFFNVVQKTATRLVYIEFIYFKNAIM